jgi:hypothetical protein
VREVAVNCLLDCLAVSIAGATHELTAILIEEARERALGTSRVRSLFKIEKICAGETRPARQFQIRSLWLSVSEDELVQCRSTSGLMSNNQAIAHAPACTGFVSYVARF